MSSFVQFSFENCKAFQRIVINLMRNYWTLKIEPADSKVDCDLQMGELGGTLLCFIFSDHQFKCLSTALRVSNRVATSYLEDEMWLLKVSATKLEACWKITSIALWHLTLLSHTSVSLLMHQATFGRGISPTLRKVSFYFILT